VRIESLDELPALLGVTDETDAAAHHL